MVFSTGARPLALGLILAAAISVVVTAQGPAGELKLVHRGEAGDVGASRLLYGTTQAQVEGGADATADNPGTRLRARIEWDEKGRVKNYERELRTARDGTLVSRISLSADETGARGRESGPIGSRSRSVIANGFEAVIDAQAPELLIPQLLDPKRSALKALVLPDWELATIVIEPRAAGGRFVNVPGGGFTIFGDGNGNFTRLVLPGSDRREIVREGTTSRRQAGLEERGVIEAPGGVRIGWTLSLPRQVTDPVPLALLLSDAGTRDRDGTGGGSQIPVLSLLAAELAERGIATARFDKRGAGESSGPEAALPDAVADAAAVMVKAAADPRVDPRRTFIVGHGEGAMIACTILRAGGVHPLGVVTLAQPCRGVADALEARLRARLMVAGEKAENIEAAVANTRAEVEVLRKSAADTDLAPSQRFLRDLIRLDPAGELAGLRIPVLVVHAAEDVEVPPAHVALLRASLAFSSDTRIRFQLLDHADHDFLRVDEGTAAGRSPGGADIAREFHPSVGALTAEFFRSLSPADAGAATRPAAPR